MFQHSKAFSGFSVKDIDEAKEFYGTVLGLDVFDNGMGLELKLEDSTPVFVYPKDDHTPASFTILNFPVDDIDEAVEALMEKGIEFIRYKDMPEVQDELGIMRGAAANMGPDIAWFRDPSGNILSVLSD